MRVNNTTHRPSVDEHAHWDVLEQEELRLAAAAQETQGDFDAGLLLTGHAEPEVTGAIIMAMCDRLLKVGVEAGAFPNVRVPLAMLASSIIPDMSDDDRCGHA